MRVDGKIMTSEAQIDADARLQSGMTVRNAVKKGYLRGVSIGYTYESKDTSWDETTRTLTVRKWRLLEASLTPIQADAAAQVRSLPFSDSKPPAAPAASQERTAMSESEKNKSQDPAANDEAQRAREIAALRADHETLKRELEASKRETSIRALASEHGVSVEGLDFSAIKDESAGLKELLKRKAANDKADIKNPVITVTRDQADKMLVRAKAAMFASARLKAEGDEVKEFAAVGGHGSLSLKAMLRQVARADGNFDADSWSDMDLAMFGARFLNLSTHGRRDVAANKITSQFSSLLANVAHKAVMAGLNSYNASTWQLWCTQRNVPNFLAVTNTGLSSGRLTETPEDVAFPELNQKDGGYNSQLGLFGATVSLTYQTIVNDTLGAFMEELRRIGNIAGLTADRLAYSKLLNATWTNDTSTGAGLATPANLDKPRAALKNKLSPAGEKMGVIARYLLHDTINANAAQVATGLIYGPGQVTAPSVGSRTIMPIESHWIGDTSLFSGALTTDYYTAGDPNSVDTVLMNFLDGVGFSPIILPFDAGAVAAEKYKIMLPMQATTATHTDGTSPTPLLRVTGIQKATVA
jgi:hypothetical protein